MKLYFPSHESVVDLLDSIVENYPGCLTYRDVIEVDVSDQSVAGFLKKLTERHPIGSGANKAAREMPSELTCKLCGKQFEPTHHKQRICPVCKEKQGARKNGATITLG